MVRDGRLFLVCTACGPGPRADADRVWEGGGADQAVGAEVDARPGRSDEPAILVTGPNRVDDPYGPEVPGRGRVWRLTASADSGPIDERATVTYSGDDERATWGDGSRFAGDLDGDGDGDVWLAGSNPAVRDSRGSAVDLARTGRVSVVEAWAVVVNDLTDADLGDTVPCGDLDGDGAAELCFDQDVDARSSPRVRPGPLPSGTAGTSSAGWEVVDTPAFEPSAWASASLSDHAADSRALLCFYSSGICHLVDGLLGGGASATGLPTFHNEAGDSIAAPVADLDDDGLGDVLFGRYLYVGKDGGTPDDAWWVLDAGDLQVVAAATGDFDGDGHPDLAVGVGHDSDLKTRIYLGPLPNRTSTEEDVALTVPGGSLAAADVDGDGADDLVVGLPTANDGAGQVQLFFGRRMFP